MEWSGEPDLALGERRRFGIGAFMWGVVGHGGLKLSSAKGELARGSNIMRKDVRRRA